jgi:hypothetical protein
LEFLQNIPTTRIKIVTLHINFYRKLQSKHDNRAQAADHDLHGADKCAAVMQQGDSPTLIAVRQGTISG